MIKEAGELAKRRTADSFEVVFERLRTVTGAKTQSQLATLLNIRQSSIADAKRRKSIPAQWVQKLMEERDINPFWLKFGEPPVLLGGGDETGLSASRITSESPNFEILVRELIARLAPEEVAEDTRRALCLKGFYLESTDTFSDILNKVLPGIIAAKIRDHVCQTFSAPKSKSSYSDSGLEQ